MPRAKPNPDIVPAALLDEVARRDFLTFAQLMFFELYGRYMKPNWHHEAIAYVLNSLVPGGKECIFMPPRNLKSFLMTIAWPAWKLGQDPRLKFLIASYGEGLIKEHAVARMRIMQSPLYQRLFPGTRLTNRTAVLDFKTTKGGGCKSTSVGGGGTGFGGDYTIIDDPINALDVNSEAAIKKALEWYQGTMVSRGDDKMAGAQLLVMQRLHEQDLGGYLVELGWPALCLPAINDFDRVVPIGGKRVHHWRAGELLHPAHEPQQVLDEILKMQGPRIFSAQYLQMPLPEQGNLIQRDWLKTYPEAPEALTGGQVIQSWDIASSLAESADYSSCVTMRKIGNRHYTIDVYRGRLPFDQLRTKIIELGMRWHPDAILIENTSSGIGMVQDLKGRPVPGLASIVPINPGVQSKYERLETHTALIAAGDLLVPERAPWLPEFLHELLGFPNAKHDDMVDALSQALAWSKRLSPPPMNVAPEFYSTDDYGNIVNLSGDDADSELTRAAQKYLRDHPELYDDPWKGL